MAPGAADRLDGELAAFWRGKHTSTPGTALPQGFPYLGHLTERGYVCVEDLDGADADELEGVGIPRRDITAVFNALALLLTPPPDEDDDMSFWTQNGRFANTLDLVLAGALTATATGTGPTIEVADRGTLRLTLSVTAAGGTTPTLDVTVQTSQDGITWRSLGVFSTQTAVGSLRESFTGADRYVRVSYAIGGTTPSFTFGVAGDGC
jgi:hypothetical protein